MTRLYCRSVALNLPDYLCAQYAGVSPRAVINWVQRGAEGEEPYATFVDAVKRQRAKAAAVLTSRISRASRDPKQWKAAAWLLERVHSKLEATPEVPGAADRPANPHVIDAADLDEEKLVLAKIDRINTDLERARAAGSLTAAKDLGRDLDKAVAELTALRAQRKKSEISDDEETFLQDLAAAGDRMPERHLRTLVDVYCQRHRLRLAPDPRWKKGEDGQWVFEEDTEDEAPISTDYDD